MLLLVGLGNPGSNYTNTRHNIGFKIIDAINAHFKLSKQKPKFKGLLTTGNIDEKKIYAIKPLTFMNNSGTAIKELIDYTDIDNLNYVMLLLTFSDISFLDKFDTLKYLFDNSLISEDNLLPNDKNDYLKMKNYIHHSLLNICINSSAIIDSIINGSFIKL